MRKSGILLPVFSLPSPYGIGGFTKEAEIFIDFLYDAKQTYWQILPLGPTTYGDSPYQSPSVFAGNPYFIDLESLCRDGLLTPYECREYADSCPKGEIDYGFLYKTRPEILHKAFERFKPDTDYYEFVEAEKYWLDPYVEFTGEEEYNKFLQYRFSIDWNRIKSYANKKGIEIIGDMPLYTACDCADVTSNPFLFDVDENLKPVHMAGCPPDSFAPDGQLWGSPVYKWENHIKTGFKWWINRMRRNMELYDVVRIDHFRGLESFYSIDGKSKDAKFGIWEPAPGKELFDALYKNVPDLRIIAEDLGFITNGVRKLLEYAKCPGMKILQFAFDSREDSTFLPHNYTEHCIVYTGTHDNPTALGWAQTADEKDREFAARYMHVDNTPEKIAEAMVRYALGSVAQTCIIPLQDWLLLGKDGRINVPGTVGNNWKFRIKSLPNSEKIAELTAVYGRKADKYV